MAILLCSDPESLARSIGNHVGEMIAVLLTTGESSLATPLADEIPELLVIDVTGPRFSRLNFDAVSLAVLDLTPEELLSSGGRRLLDVLGRLAEESLTLAFVGAATATVGTLLQDGETAGLNLIPRSVVIDDVLAVPDLNALLASLSQSNVRLLALDRPVGAVYDFVGDWVRIENTEAEDGAEDSRERTAGNALLAAFKPGPEGPTVRLQMLSAGMQRRWPE